MVNKYIKAIFLTSILFLIGVFLMNVLDSSRIENVSNEIEIALLDSEATQQLFFYETIFDESESVCVVLSERIDLQIEKTRTLLSELESTNSQVMFGDTKIPKLKYRIQNIQLYLLIEKARKDCGNVNVSPVLYFFPENESCADCVVQAKVLDSLVLQNNKLRVFAMPVGTDIPVADALAIKYGVSTYPAVVIEGKVFTGLISEEVLKSAISS